jgi:type IV secretory pathway VirD2 relaxase
MTTNTLLKWGTKYHYPALDATLPKSISSYKIRNSSDYLHPRFNYVAAANKKLYIAQTQIQ